MKCLRCLNTDKSFFYKGSRGWYCRKCIAFGRIMLEETVEEVVLSDISDGSYEYQLNYELTLEQKAIGKACAQTILHSDVLLQCVCGAGKTEMVLESIAMMLKLKRKVCFAIPRRQVVMELGLRLQKLFPFAEVVRVCSQMTGKTDGDLIVCTTHQLYRYYQAFDCLILDEPDAFPFRGNSLLHGIAETSCRGNCIYLTATPDKTLLDRVKNGTLTRFQLNRRPHGHLLPVPELKIGWKGYLLFCLYQWLQLYQEYPRMLFVPTIVMARQLYRWLSIFYDCYLCTSQTENRDEVILKYRSSNRAIMVTTTVMERGVTIDNVQVCVIFAEHTVFDLASLIQMSGRVGRSFQYPNGSVLFLCCCRSQIVEQCIQELERVNQLSCVV